MATDKQIEASRRNGALSRGPATTEGKARSRFNGVKHGIYSKAIVIGNEDPNAYALILDQYLAEWQPANATEHRLVTDIVNANWRIDRITVYEGRALELELERMRPEVDEVFETIDEGTRSTLAFNSIIANNQTFQTLQTALRTHYRLRDRAITLLLRLQRERRASDSNTAPSTVTTKPTPDTPDSSAAGDNTSTNAPAATAMTTEESTGTKPREYANTPSESRHAATPTVIDQGRRNRSTSSITRSHVPENGRTEPDNSPQNEQHEPNQRQQRFGDRLAS